MFKYWKTKTAVVIASLCDLLQINPWVLTELLFAIKVYKDVIGGKWQAEKLWFIVLFLKEFVDDLKEVDHLK